MPQFTLIPDITIRKDTPEALPKMKYARKYQSINLDAFRQDLDKLDQDSTDVKHVDLYGSTFLHVFNRILDIHAPITKIKISKRSDKRNAKPWITNDIVKLIKTKEKPFKRFIKEENKVTKVQIYKTHKDHKMR